MNAPARSVGIGTHYLRYTTANALVMVAGLISFPALTRLLDNAQYGILGYYETWVMMAVAIAKFGAQHAIIRFYPYTETSKKLPAFATNFFFVPLLLSLSLCALGLTVFVAVGWLGGVSFSPVLWCAVAAIPLLVFGSLVQMMLRAGEQSGTLVLTRVASRWLELLLMLSAVLLLERSALAAYGGKLLAAVAVTVFYIRWVCAHLSYSRTLVDLGELRRSMVYGLPLVVNEIAAVALISIDRVMLKGLLDDFVVVGIYTVGYSLALQVSIFMQASLSESFLPLANKAHETGAADDVRALKRKVLLPLTYASIGVGVAIAAVGADVLRAISGPDKAASGEVFAWIGTMYALMPLVDIIGYGLLLQRRSMTVLGLTLAAALLNIGLNLVWIPQYSYMGAVYATAVSYGALGVASCWMCPRSLLQLPDGRALAIACGGALAFLAVVQGTQMFGLENPLARMFAAGLAWLLLFVAPAVMLDARLRALLTVGLKRLPIRALRGG